MRARCIILFDILEITGPNVPGQLSARKVGERKRGNGRGCEGDGRRKGARVGDEGEAKKKKV